tara:strand:+ start:13531 stop:19611 length:6081 start_codon:yes stop_codon:yes gene_type:complete
MAEFKLGRIKFVWKGSWATTTTYYVDDVIRYGGRTYNCVTNHTSGTFQTDLGAVKWQLMSDGIEWKSDWVANTTYKPNDVVKYGGYIYLANTGHTSAATVALGLEADQSKWDLFIEGFDWKSDWTISTRYKKNDLVKYGGSVYLCITEHESDNTTAVGLEGQQAKWEIFGKGFVWSGDWAINTRYKVNDTVRYGGQIYVAITGHTSAATEADGLEANQGQWQALHKGIEFKGDHATATRYKVNDVVKYGANIWICTTQHTSSGILSADEANWSILIPGIEFEDTWSNSTNYQPGDFVTYGGYSYVADRNNINKLPPDNSSDWTLFVTGFNLRGDYNVATAYKQGDVVRLGGFTYLAIADGTGNRPPNVTKWDKLNEGLYWKGAWTNATAYDKGDIVRGTTNTTTSYLCITEHTSNNVGPSTINQPDYPPGAGVDTSAWQLLAGGAESSVLSTKGDLLIYGQSGPARLPIGKAGQTLVVNSAGDLPEWGYFGSIDQVYYVGPAGQDKPSPDAGTTLDKPWKSLRYALHGIEQGPRNPQGTYLLERNKAFIQEETLAWINAQISGNTSPFTNAYTYDAVKCRRDAGFMLDALLYDLRHGGNEKSRYATLRISTQTEFVNHKDELTAYLNRLVYISQQVVANNAGYSALQGTVPHYINNDYVSEAAVSGEIASYVKIATDCLAAGNIAGVPAEEVPQTTLFVKSGTYEEVLPLSVKKGLAIVGDELRSTIVKPAGQVTDSSDTVFTLEGIGRMQAIISDIVTNASVTPTPVGGVITFTTPGADLGFVNGTYNNVAVTGGSGSGCTMDVTILSYTITSLTINNPGQNYAINDNLTIPAATIGADGITVVGSITTGNNLTQNTSNPAGSGAAGTAAAAIAQNIYDHIDFKVNANGADSTLTGTNTAQADAGYSDARLRLLANMDFVALEVAEFVQRANPSHSNFKTKCLADVKIYLQAIMDDLQYTGNYKSLKASDAYINSRLSTGSSASDMFYCRNATGIRNMTVQGLIGTLGTDQYSTSAATYTPATGEMILTIGSHSIPVGESVMIASNSLTFTCAEDSHATQHSYPRSSDPYYNKAILITAVAATTITVNVGISSNTTAHTFVNATENNVTLASANEFGTKRPTGGSFVSLDPGWGPTHEEVWITSKSPYIQNVTTFGTGCTGLKVDGALHDGGFDSVVANDFTQLCDDGIGAWITNLGRVELVSVFSYYAHIGYLSENGGKLRATNGNSSYGDFGCVAEGVDSAETPTTATIDNHSEDADVANVMTDGQGILAFEYKNAGRQYSSATLSISGDGYGITGETPTYNTGGVYKIRLLETNTVTSNLGGATYMSATNNGQTGSATQITIANADSNASGAYTGMAIWITKGKGVGQYAYIDAYDSASKVATVKKYSDDLSGWERLGGLSVETLLDATTEYTIEPRVVIGAPQNDGSTAVRQAVARAIVTSEKISSIRIIDCGASYTSAPTVTFTDPNNTVDAPVQSFIDDGVLGQPTFSAYGTAYNTASVTITESPTGKNITGITQGTVAVVTSAGHNLVSGTKVTFTGVVGMTELNTGVWYYIKTLTVDTFGVYTNDDLTAGLNTTNFTAYSSGGVATPQGGFRDEFQTGRYIQVEGMSDVPQTGSNVEFDGISTTTYPYAYTLLTANKEYMKDEVIAWFNTIYPGIHNAAQNTKCERDVGYEIDAMAFDIKYGGNTETIRIAKTYWQGVTSQLAAGEQVYAVAVNNKLKEMINDYIMDNVAWTTTQSPVVTSQTTNSNNGELGVKDKFTNLIKTLNDVIENGLTSVPTTQGLNNPYFKLVSVQKLRGTQAPYSALLQISPQMSTAQALAHGTGITVKLRYSQVRLTGHDFLDVGTGNQALTNYPGTPNRTNDQERESVERGGGRVFFTATDQDGNFRVGDLFSVQQATGIASLNADAFNISGLQELQLGDLTLGGTSASVNEFSTDGTFAANSDKIVPTQRAIRTYVSSQIGGGASAINVNTITAGQIVITSNTISTTTGASIQINAGVNFKKGVAGAPLAMNYLIHS